MAGLFLYMHLMICYNVGMSKNLRLWSLIGLALFVVGGAFVFFYYKNHNFGGAVPHPSPAVPKFTLELPRLSEESSSKIPQGFPRQFIMGDVPGNPLQVVSATVVKDDPQQIQMSLTFKAAVPVAELVSEYKNYAAKVGWSIANESQTATSYHLLLTHYFRKISLDMIQTTDGVIVTIDYNVILPKT